jgi:hypothetical protein
MTKELLRPFPGKVTLLVAMIFYAGTATSYSVLTHQELIDLAWNDSIRPLLLAKFPSATEAQLVDAHAYAYGGCAIQDMGYYPFGKQFFSDLTHYVRSGDFVMWLFRNAHTVDEYAFAIGALSHYLGDSIGHSEAINPATAIAFPKLGRKFGSKVTYDESPHGHIRTEFAFDIDELTNTAFAPPAYLRLIGLKVPTKFLEQAFFNTYGFDIHEVLGRAHPAVRSYRASVRSFIPAFDLDTGERVKLEDYRRADKTYAGLLERLTSKATRTIPEDLKRDIIGYYAASGTALRERVQRQLNLLKSMTGGDGLR